MRGIWLKPVEPDDYEFTYNIRKENGAFFFLPLGDYKTHKAYMGNLDHEFFIIMLNDVMIGTISIRYNIVIGNVIIIASQRGRGYGKKVIDLVCKLIRARGGKRAELEVKANNMHAINFYHRQGFHIKEAQVTMEVELVP